MTLRKFGLQPQYTCRLVVDFGRISLYLGVTSLQYRLLLPLDFGTNGRRAQCMLCMQKLPYAALIRHIYKFCNCTKALWTAVGLLGKLKLV